MRYRGTDIRLGPYIYKDNVDRWDACATLCKENDNCKGWSYFTGKQCWLKSAVSGRTHQRRPFFQVAHWISGKKDCPKGCEIVGRDFLGADIWDGDVSSWE